MHEFDKCVIVDSEGKPITEGFVRAFASGKMDIGTVKDVKGWLQGGQHVRVYIYNASLGECIYEGNVQSALILHVTLSPVTMVTNRQKRNNTRVNVELPYLIRYYVDKDGKHPFESPLHVTILNISAEGVYLSCKSRFDIGFRFAFIFREASHDIPVIAETIRRDITVGGFRYGCHFIDILQNDSDEIHRWVFQKQIELRREQAY